MCYENRLTGLDIRSCRNLQILECSHNQITELNTKNNRSLKKLIPKKKKVTYTYNCGRGFKKKFTLVINRK